MSLIHIQGDLLTIHTTYIVHQCNCLSTKPKGLAEKIFANFPWSDCYSNGQLKEPGTILLGGNGITQRYVVNFLSQYYAGKSRAKDTAAQREIWFSQCLNSLLAILKPGDSVAFPHNIGCNLAGGNWNNYSKLLEIFAKQAKDIQVFIVKL